MDSQEQLLAKFLTKIRFNPFVGPSHISFYVALLELSRMQGSRMPLIVKRNDVMDLARIRGIATYHRVVNDLVKSECVRYDPRYNRKGNHFYL